MSQSAEACARAVLEGVPEVIRVIRSQMRQHRGTVLSVPQFRTLVLLEAQPGTTMSRVAEHVGLSLPSASTLVEGLVQRALVARQPHPTDRRRVALALTAHGRTVITSARRHTQAFLAEHLAALSDGQRATVAEAMQLLRQAFGPSSTG